MTSVLARYEELLSAGELRKDADQRAAVIELARDPHCPLFAVFGADDSNPSPADAELLRDQLESSGKPFQLEVFDKAGHAFFADYRPSYHEVAAFALWSKVTSFFDAHLG